MTHSRHIRHTVIAPDGLRADGRVRRSGLRAWIDPLSRMGLVTRGILYLVSGGLALAWALGRHRQPMNQASVIDLIGHQPLGRVLLVLVAVGLAGYAIWGMVRAVRDPHGRGRGPAGIAMRVGNSVSAITYLGLLVATVGVLTGNLSRVEPRGNWTVEMMARPFGGVVVMVIGLIGIVGSGIAQIVTGWRHGFEHDLALDRRSRTERRFAVALGHVGLVSRGIVFTLVGVLLVAGALRLRPDTALGPEGALIELAHRPFGRALLAAAGLGLMAFGAYSAMGARWMRMHRVASAPVAAPFGHAPREHPR